MDVSVHFEVQCKCPILITQGTLRNVCRHEICIGLFTLVFEICTGLFTHDNENMKDEAHEVR